MSDEQGPSPAALAAELTSVLRTGITTQQLRRCPTILGLAITHAKAASDRQDDLAVAAHTLVTEAALRVDYGSHGPAANLLGLAPGTRGSLLKDRRRWAADALSVSPEHLRKDREPLLLEAVADELYAADSAYRLRHQHRTEPERRPERSGLRVDWLDQHRSYRRIWTPITGMKNDIYVLRRYLKADQEDRDAISDRLVNITWNWARFQLALEQFIKEQGGLWLLADMDREIAAADAVYEIGFYMPLGETDCSWLRAMLIETPHQELDGYGDKLIAAGQRRKELMSTLVAWASCTRPDDEPDCDCALHHWLRAGDRFIRLIDEDWYQIADYYRESDRDTSGLDAKALWSR